MKLFRLSAAALLVLTAISTPTHSLSATRVDARKPLRVVLQGGPGGRYAIHSCKSARRTIKATCKIRDCRGVRATTRQSKRPQVAVRRFDETYKDVLSDCR